MCGMPPLQLHAGHQPLAHSLRCLPLNCPHLIIPAPTPGELSGDNIEVAVVGEDRKFRVLTPAEVADYLAEVE